ncbi:MAG: TIGR04552 family protein [Acidobacteria bacterium]|nr:TIGR04552 family protein [Acidobacteriota bacterium]
MVTAPAFPLPPEVTQVVLGGGSSIDLEGMRCGSRAEAREFGLAYGYDLTIPVQAHQVRRVQAEAVAFLETVILDSGDPRPPVEVRDCEDPLDLLVWASARPRDARAAWSCAVLRVMHTLFYLDHDVNLRFLPEIQRQVFTPYDRHLVLEGGRWKLRGVYEVELAGVEKKEQKDRASMLLKLLHKPENVAETIYDHIGIRFVAQDRLGVLQVIRFLLDHHALLPTHIKPSRSRNRMIDLDALKTWMGSLPPAFELAALDPGERAALNRRLALRDEGAWENPFTAQDYAAVQFTARTLIRLASPATAALETVQARLKALGHPELMSGAGLADLLQEQEQLTFFFAHEVQVMEESGFRNSQSGPASHGEYKLRQREAARRRVLQGIL